MKNNPVCPLNTSLCVRSKRPREYRHHAHTRFNTCVRVVPENTGTFSTYTQGRIEWTHGGVLSGHQNTHAHTRTHAHTENTHTQDTHTRPKQDKKQRFFGQKIDVFFDAPENVICTKSLFPNVRVRSARARGRCAADAQCGLKTPLEPLTKSFTADYSS